MRHIRCGRRISSAFEKCDAFELYRICLRTVAAKKVVIPHNGVSLLFVNTVTKIGRQNKMCVEKCHEVLVNLAACILCLSTVLNHERNVSLVNINIVLFFIQKNKCCKI